MLIVVLVMFRRLAGHHDPARIHKRDQSRLDETRSAMSDVAENYNTLLDAIHAELGALPKKQIKYAGELGHSEEEREEQ